MKKIKQSETRIIKRSQINLNPFNPKAHSEDAIKKQLNNFKKYGYNGGIVWNERTGNLIDGHRRILAQDALYKYDGKNDYDVKVEVVSYSEKEELEQLTYMAIGNTKADINLIAKYAPKIDYENIGIPDNELQALNDLLGVDTEIDVGVEILDIGFEPYEDKKEKVKAAKEEVRQRAEEKVRDENAYITLSFSTHSAKEAFCNLMNIDTTAKFAKGEDILNQIE